MSQRSTPIVLVIASALLVPGCSAPNYQDSVAFRVVDARSGSPIEGADVIARPLKFYLPIDHSPSPTPGNFQGDSGVTDASGEVSLRLARNAPSELIIAHPDFPVWHGLIEPWENADRQPTWRMSDLDQGPTGDAGLTAEIIDDGGQSQSAGPLD